MELNFTENIYIQKNKLKQIKNYLLIILNVFFSKYTIDILITNNDYIKDLNKKFRNINSSTDVLSFPIYHFKHFIPLEKLHMNEDNKIFIGDIVISYEKIVEQSIKYNNTIEKECIYLFIHSMLHLVGYDHNNVIEKECMRQKEKDILKYLNI